MASSSSSHPVLRLLLRQLLPPLLLLLVSAAGGLGGRLAQAEAAAAASSPSCDDSSAAAYVPGAGDTSVGDRQTVAFPLNLEYLETEFFAYGALGHGLDTIAPALAAGGPPPLGAQRANLSSLVRDIVAQFAFQEVGHVTAIRETVGSEAFPRPLLDLSKKSFAAIFDKAFKQRLNPPFDAYANSINYLLASYVIPYVGLTGYVGANPLLASHTAKRLVAGLLGVEAGQDAVIRGLLYEARDEVVAPYRYTVAQFTERVSALRNELDGVRGVSDEGIVVPPCLSAAGGAAAATGNGTAAVGMTGNVLAGDRFSVAYARTPEEVLRVVYGTGDAAKPGGFFPRGASGAVAAKFRAGAATR